jgi:GNAT superfamily N-acetyltransferase
MDERNQQLDNPVWFALNETHAEYSVGHANIKFYEPEYCPFGAITSSDDLTNPLQTYSESCHNFYIVGQKPPIPPSLYLRKQLVCLQMMIERTISYPSTEEIIAIGSDHANELFQLVNLVQPGYFKSKTRLLGEYFGIFKDDILVAVTGERMKMDGFTEVSAVVTHPEYTGRGYAKQLVGHTVNEILKQNKIPFLHVAENNESAINLYLKLGFGKRRKMNFWQFETV